MTDSRQRTIDSINHRQPDRPPIYVSVTPQIAERLSEMAGVPCEPPIDAMESARISHMELLTNMGADLVAIAPTAPPNAPTRTLPDGRIVNEWGMVFREVGIYTEFDEHPLAEASVAEDIRQYPFPDPLAPTMTKNSPASTSRLRSLRAATLPSVTTNSFWS